MIFLNLLLLLTISTFLKHSLGLIFCYLHLLLEWSLPMSQFSPSFLLKIWVYDGWFYVSLFALISIELFFPLHDFSLYPYVKNPQLLMSTMCFSLVSAPQFKIPAGMYKLNFFATQDPSNLVISLVTKTQSAISVLTLLSFLCTISSSPTVKPNFLLLF